MCCGIAWPELTGASAFLKPDRGKVHGLELVALVESCAAGRAFHDRAGDRGGSTTSEYGLQPWRISSLHGSTGR